MNFVVILIGFQLVLITFASLFNWPFGGTVRTIYRRIKSDGLRQIYQAKSLDLGIEPNNTFKKADKDATAKTSSVSGSVDWRQNTLQRNKQETSLPSGKVSVKSIKNPIMPPSSDPFDDKDHTPPDTEGDGNWRMGPVQVKNGQIRISLE